MVVTVFGALTATRNSIFSGGDCYGNNLWYMRLPQCWGLLKFQPFQSILLMISCGRVSNFKNLELLLSISFSPPSVSFYEQLKPGGEISKRGKKITLYVKNVKDLTRDVIKVCSPFWHDIYSDMNWRLNNLNYIYFLFHSSVLVTAQWLDAIDIILSSPFNHGLLLDFWIPFFVHYPTSVQL